MFTRVGCWWGKRRVPGLGYAVSLACAAARIVAVWCLALRQDGLLTHGAASTDGGEPLVDAGHVHDMATFEQPQRFHQIVCWAGLPIAGALFAFRHCFSPCVVVHLFKVTEADGACRPMSGNLHTRQHVSGTRHGIGLQDHLLGREGI